jgi:hypothetical protein
MAQKLAQSKGYVLEGDYETATLTGYGQSFVVGDHFGDVICGCIDEAEKWCVTGGEGLIIYFLDPPFCAYARSSSTPQWAEIGRTIGSSECPEAVRQLDQETVRVTLSTGEYKLNVYTLVFTPASEA